MATAPLRAGRRLLPFGAKSVIPAEADVAAASSLQRQARAPTTATSSSLLRPYQARVDLTSPLMELLAPSSQSRAATSTASVGQKVDAGELPAASRRAPVSPRHVDAVQPPLLHCPALASHHGPTTAALGLEPQVAGSPGSSGGVACISGGCSATRSSRPYHPHPEILRGSASSINRVRMFCHPHPQTVSGAAICFRRNFSSISSPCGPSSHKQILRGSSIYYVRKFSADGSGSVKPNPPEESKSMCNLNSTLVMAKLDSIDHKVTKTGEQYNILNNKVEGTVETCKHLKSDIEKLQEAQKGSGDWTSIKIFGKNLNLLAVGRAIADIWNKIPK